MWHWCVRVAVMAVMSHAIAASHDGFLLDDCNVKGITKNLQFDIYDDTITLHLARKDPNTSPSIVIKQNRNEWTFILRDVVELWKWEDVELKLGEKPEVYLNNKKINANDSPKDMKKKMWEVEVKNAFAYAGCQKRWPVLELDSTQNREYFNISQSGHNDMIRLLPTEATIVFLMVGKDMKVLCLGEDNNHVVVKVYDSGQTYPSQTCKNLPSNIFTEEIDIPDDYNQSLTILKERLSGVLYIMQCVDNCAVPYTPNNVPGSSTSYYVMMGFMIIFIIIAVVEAVLLFIWKK